MTNAQPPSPMPGAIRWEAARTAAMVAQLPAVISNLTYPAVVRQAALDSFYVRSRTLIEYLEIPRPKAQQPKKKDFKASDVVQGWTSPSDATRNARLIDHWTDASKHFVHFSQVRPDQVSKTAAEIQAVADDVLDVWQELSACSNRKDGFVPSRKQLDDMEML